MNQAQHIEVSLDRQTIQQISANRLHLKTSIDVVRWLSFQRCAFRGHDESLGSKNHGKFLELLSLLALYDEKAEDVLKSSPHNVSYSSSTIQKEILQIYASKVLNVIRKEISDRKFSIIVDEVKEQFFDIVHVKDTASLTLKNVIFNVLLQHSYDGASNMRGEFNSLQALILNDCRYAYYVHYFAHRLQLTLVAVTREVVEVHQLFKDLSDIIGTLQCPGETRWISHLNSVTSLLKMYNTSIVLENLKNTASNYSQLRSFEFIFILHMMKEVLGITDNLCQALQCRSQDILNLRNDGWNELLKNSRFNDNVVELLTLTKALDLKDFFMLFDIDKIFILVNKFYLEDFSQQEKERLPYELKHYELDVCNHPNLRKISTLFELCRSLVESGKSVMYPLVDRLIHLILTLLVSIILNTRLHRKIEKLINKLQKKLI
ncbi:hypothetical protein V6Z11_A05G332900 [Gossypium hirsutum]